MARKKPPVRPSKYKDTMPDELILMMSKGATESKFCAHHKISRSTFRGWLDSKPEFKEAYEIGLMKAKEWHESLARDHLVEEYQGPKLNTNLWGMLMRNNHGYGDARKLEVAGLAHATTPTQQVNAIMAELANGGLSGGEAVQLANVVLAGVKAEEAVELERRISEIEKANSLGLSDDEFKEVP